MYFSLKFCSIQPTVESVESDEAEMIEDMETEAPPPNPEAGERLNDLRLGELDEDDDEEEVDLGSPKDDTLRVRQPLSPYQVSALFMVRNRHSTAFLSCPQVIDP